ncbi:adenylyl-sulfate kinase (plasmid) [Deltaproteobacteria bacterium Smac51]|nr:adenylyl-sulfate kinase [Deltaproteobacteria bacterium Smac51]
MSEAPVLKILSCGSVDDGKSTLIGRLLYDCGALYEDQLALLEKERTAEGLPDLSCLLDGLLAEREQAITIDVAYRSFRTAARRYLVADAPGHEQYTRNMVTGASRADVALLLIDATRARRGLLPQTVRHTVIAALMGIPDIIVAINKMDLLGYEQPAFGELETEYRRLIKDLDFRSVACVPVSALKGDNVASASVNMPWYSGKTILELLENNLPPEKSGQPFCLPVQWVARRTDFRGLSGTVAAGSIKTDEKVVLLPSGLTGTVRDILTPDGPRTEAAHDEAVCIRLTEDLDISRGEFLVAPENRPEVSDHLAAEVIWLNEPPLVPGRTYIYRLGPMEGRATITELSARLDLNTMAEVPAKQLNPNDVGWVKLRLDRPVPFRPYTENRDLGGFLLIDRMDGNTVGAGLIRYALRRSHHIVRHNFELNQAACSLQKGQKPGVFWFTGLSASGKSTIADLTARRLYELGRHVYVLDGDNLRCGLNSDLGFTEADRAENIRRASEVAALMVEAGLIVLASFISPYSRDRAAIRDRFAPAQFHEIFVDTPLSECIKRDPKGLYAKAIDGQLPNFTGISSEFERPETPDLRLNGLKQAESLADEVLDFIEGRQK